MYIMSETSNTKKMCIIVPTMNRPECIETLLEDMHVDLVKYDVDLWIYDTSPEKDTEDVYNSYKQRHKAENIIYKRINNYPDKTTDYKVVTAIRELWDRYEYLWLSGDGICIKLDNVMELLVGSFNNFVDIVHFDNKKNSKTEIITKYTDVLQFFKNHATLLTRYSTTIVSSRLAKKINWDSLANKYRNTGFLYWSGIFHELSAGKYNIVVFNIPYMQINAKRKDNAGFTVSGNYMKFWVEWWPKVVYELPDCYNKYKQEVCLRQGKDNKIFGAENLLRMRAKNNLNIELVRKHREHFKYATKVPVCVFYMVAVIPKPIVFVIRCIIFAKNKIKCKYKKYIR